MKQQGKCITGDLVRVDDYTSDWISVRIHPTTYYRKINDIELALKQSKNMYAQIDFGDYILIRFADKEDMITFHQLYECV